MNATLLGLRVKKARFLVSLATVIVSDDRLGRCKLKREVDNTNQEKDYYD